MQIKTAGDFKYSGSAVQRGGECRKELKSGLDRAEKSVRYGVRPRSVGCNERKGVENGSESSGDVWFGSRRSECCSLLVRNPDGRDREGHQRPSSQWLNCLDELDTRWVRGPLVLEL